MKKIAILTFHRALNYGANLQAFALQEIVGTKFEAYILDYRCPAIENFYFKKKSLKDIIKSIIFPRLTKQLRIHKHKFIEFRNMYRLSNVYTPFNIENANLEMDGFIAGSDQIWNPRITDFDYNYFLQFAEKRKRYTYAVSLGKAKITDWDKNKIDILLNDLNNISLREKTSVEMIKSFNSELCAYAVLDPVFLLTKNQWIEKLNLNHTKVQKKYIFVYIVAPNTYAIEKAKAIAKQNSLEICYIDALRYKDSMITNINNAGPREFLNYLFNAELIITTSFHALAFSLIFNKPFLYELSKEKINANSRLLDLTDIFGIENYQITNVTSEYTNKYDWREINLKIDDMRAKSISLLFDSLKRV